MRFAAAIAFFAGLVAAQTTTAAGAQSTECPAAKYVHIEPCHAEFRLIVMIVALLRPASTLLKQFSRIVLPTTGLACVMPRKQLSRKMDIQCS
jgi:hypothetical protein